jgi:uncharacterized protein YfaS (alpha-2-macroglobulin family)
MCLVYGVPPKDWYIYDFIDFREDKVSLFRTNLWWSYDNNLSYVVRANYSGNFQAPAPYAAYMYSPNEFSFGDFNNVTIK